MNIGTKLLELGPQLGALALLAFVAMVLLVKSFNRIGPLEIGLVRKNFSFKKHPQGDDCPIAFNGEAGYQATLLQSGLHLKLWPLFSVTKHPRVQIPTDSVGVVVAQFGRSLPQGRQTAIYKQEFGHFVDLRAFLDNGGEKGVQRPVLQPGEAAAIHPIAFLVLSTRGVYGIPVDQHDEKREARLADFGLNAEQLRLVSINYVNPDKQQGPCDAVGVVTVIDGDPLPEGDIACRLGGWDDIEQLLATPNATDADIVARLLASKNAKHQNYQNMQAFFDAGGRRGIQHDPLMPGQYALNPFLVRVELEKMLRVRQGEVAVVNASLGLRPVDESGEGFKHGSIVRPGRRGLWIYALRTGTYPLNPRLYKAEMVPTAIISLNWSDETGVHSLDRDLGSITAKSREGFDFVLELQVQIHVPDTRAPIVISRVGTMSNLVHEVMRPAVVNFFLNSVQSAAATGFIEKRDQVQKAAGEYVGTALKQFDVEVIGVFIQALTYPRALVEVLTERELAAQERMTLDKQKDAQAARAEFEKARGAADAQAALAHTSIRVQIAANEAEAVKQTAEGEAYRITKIGDAQASRIRAEGEAQGAAYVKQVDAIGREATTAVNIAQAIRDGNIKVMPETLVVGGGGGLEGFAAILMQAMGGGLAKPQEARPVAQPTAPAPSTARKPGEPPKALNAPAAPANGG